MNNNEKPNNSTKKEVSSLDLENKKREAAAYWKQGFSAGIEFLYNRFYFLTDVIDERINNGDLEEYASPDEKGYPEWDEDKWEVDVQEYIAQQQAQLFPLAAEQPEFNLLVTREGEEYHLAPVGMAGKIILKNIDDSGEITHRLALNPETEIFIVSFNGRRPILYMGTARHELERHPTWPNYYGTNLATESLKILVDYDPYEK